MATMTESQTLEKLSIDTIRTLAMDAVQKANSGHPGAPMGLAPVAYALWNCHLRYDPADPTWPTPDRPHPPRRRPQHRPPREGARRRVTAARTTEAVPPTRE